MTGIAPILLLALGCWLLRALFIALIEEVHLPPRVRLALAHLPPAILGALVALGVATSPSGGDDAGTTAAALLCIAVIAVVAYVRPSLTVSAALGLVSIVLVDLVLP